MANHKSAKKRIRQTEKRRMLNRSKTVSMRNAIRKLRGMTDKAEAEKFYPEVASMLDRAAKANIIHKNKASNLRSKLVKVVNNL